MAKSKRKNPSVKAASIIESTRLALILPDMLPLQPRAFDGRKTLAPLANWVRWQRLDFNMQHQQQTEWCWAAVATSLALYYDPGSTWTQCSVANAMLPGRDCCGADASGACNAPMSLTNTLQTTIGHLVRKIPKAATFVEAQGEVDGGRPLGVRTAWGGDDNNAHLLMIIGYHPLFDMLGVDDPLYGKSDVDYTAFCTDYQNAGGVWNRTYFTTP